jgi:hypothetical protein
MSFLPYCALTTAVLTLWCAGFVSVGAVPAVVNLYRGVTDEYVNSDMARNQQVPMRHRARPGQRLPAGSQVNHNTDEYYVVKDLKFGNPPQSLNLTLHTDDHYSLLFADGFSQAPCTGFTPGSRKLFHPKKSTTFRYHNGFEAFTLFGLTNDNAACPQADDFDFNAQHSTDDIHIGAYFTATDIPFLTIHQFTNVTLDSQWASNGVLGMMRNDQAYPANYSTIHLLASALGEPEVSLFFNREHSSLGDGKMTIGGHDEENCEGWTYLPPKGGLINWQLEANYVQVGSFKQTNITYVDFEVETAGIWAPPLDFLEVVMVTGAEYLPTGDYVLDCNKVDQLPNIEIEFVGYNNANFTMSISPKDYARNMVPRNDGKCVLQVGSNEDGWTIGTLAKDYCWAMHYGQEKFGLAKRTTSS